MNDVRTSSFIESQIVEGYFKKNQQGDYNSVTISGKVQSEEKNEVLPCADVTLGNDVTGEVYATTHTGADGSYVLSGLNADLFKNKEKLDELTIHTSYPQKEIRYNSLEAPTVIDEGGIGYVKIDLNMSDADVAILGADFHKNFIVTLDFYLPDGTKYPDECHKWTVENVGFKNRQIPLGATFTVDENGVFSGRADQVDPDWSYVLITCKPVGQDGYSFDYIELNGTKYYVGDSFEFQEGVKGLTAVVHYTNGTGEGQIAQTGDAIPFVAIVGLGIVAVVAFVVARKKFN